MRSFLRSTIIALSLGFTASLTVVGQPVEEEVTLDTETGTIHGTVLMPAEEGPFPGVLIIAGSGPTDRDGNNAMLPGKNNSLKLLAEGLAERGIASVRYDKRGIGASAAAAPSESDLRFQTYVKDAAAWVEWMRKETPISSVTMIGHSEGSLIGMLATERAEASGFVSIAGPARAAADLLRDQLSAQLPPNLMAEADAILSRLETGKTVADVAPQLHAVFRASVQPYLISWFEHVPAEEIVTLEAPVLLVQGTTDIQVPVSEAEALKGARPDAELVIIEGMNHVLKMVPKDQTKQVASYGDPSLPVSEELLERVAAFVHETAGAGR